MTSCNPFSSNYTYAIQRDHALAITGSIALCVLKTAVVVALVGIITFSALSLTMCAVAFAATTTVTAGTTALLFCCAVLEVGGVLGLAHVGIPYCVKSLGKQITKTIALIQN